MKVVVNFLGFNIPAVNILKSFITSIIYLPQNILLVIKGFSW
jgi:hypothetical protein